MAVTAVVFDLDYTLAVPDRDREQLLEDAVSATGAPPLSRKHYLAVHRRGHQHETREPIFAELLAAADSSVDPSTITRAYREAIASSLLPVRNVAAMIEDLRGRYRVGLLTNGPIRAQLDKLETLGWETLFDEVVITGSLEAGKPSPRAFEAVLEKLDVCPEEAVYVGDDVEMDIGGATAVGMWAIQVCYPGGPDPDPRAVTAIDRDDLPTALPRVIHGLELFDPEIADPSRR